MERFITNFLIIIGSIFGHLVVYEVIAVWYIPWILGLDGPVYNDFTYKITNRIWTSYITYHCYINTRDFYEDYNEQFKYKLYESDSEISENDEDAIVVENQDHDIKSNNKKTIMVSSAILKYLLFSLIVGYILFFIIGFFFASRIDDYSPGLVISLIIFVIILFFSKYKIRIKITEN